MPGVSLHLAVWDDAFGLPSRVSAATQEFHLLPRAGLRLSWVPRATFLDCPGTAMLSPQSPKRPLQSPNRSESLSWVHPSGVSPGPSGSDPNSQFDIQGFTRLGPSLSPGPLTLLSVLTLSTARSSKGCEVSLPWTLWPHGPSAKLPLHQA